MKRKSEKLHSEPENSLSPTDLWFRTTLYSIGDGVITVDAHKKVLQLNPVAEKLTGWKEQDAQGKLIEDIFTIVSEETRQPVENPAGKVIQNGTVVGLANHTILISRDGTEIPIADTGAPIRDDNENIIGVVIVFRDQTIEREAERKIKESERRFATLVANLPGMAYRCRNDHNWTMEFVSEGSYQLTGYTPDDLVHNNLISYNEIIHPDYRNMVWESFQASLEKNEQFDGEYKIITKNGEVKWVWEQGQGIYSDDGSLIAIEGFITDITSEKETSTALSESQQMVENILNAIPVRVFWKDREGRYLGCNKPFAIDSGIGTPADIIGKDDYQMGWIEQAELYRGDDREVIESKKPKIGYEEPQTSKDGRNRWLRTSKMPLKNIDGDIIGILGTYEDITEYREAVESLRRSESIFRTVWEESRDGMRLTNEEGIVIRVNEAFCRMVNMAREDIEGKPLSVIYSPERADHIQKEHQKRFSTQTVIPHFERELILHDGRKIWFEVSNSYFKQPGNDPLLLSVFRDVTTRIQAEKSLRESEEKYRTLFEESKDTVYITSPDGKVIDINPAGVEVFGFESKEEFKKVDIMQDLYWNPADREEYVRKLNEDGYVKDYEVVLKRKDGTKFTVLETASVMRDAQNKPIAYRGILRDITQQRMLEQQLRQAQKLESIGTLAGGIAHDFNNILSIIVGHASLMSLHSSDPEKLSKGIATIQKATERGASLVQQLLTFARKSDVMYESVRINEVIREIAQLLKETLPKKIELRIHQNPSIPSIIADATQIHQVILNLCLNARDAMPDGGKLTINSTVVDRKVVREKFVKAGSDNYVMVQVTDTGIGIDDSMKQRIFDPFFTTKGPGKGSGLGLALVYSIVESYSGHIDIESQPGMGSTFSIYFPVQITAPISNDMLSEVDSKELDGNETILIIEDEDMLLDSLKSNLTQRGYTVLSARDGIEGVNLYSLYATDLFGKGIDVVISDIGLPKLGGQDVFKKIKKVNPEAHIIMASGYIDPEVKTELKQAGAKHFIQKPYVPNKVMQTIRSILDQ